MKEQKGFTLIELVVVIVILGILAAVAAPKFIDISSDARIATLEGVEGALKGGNSLVYSKALIKGIEKLDCTKDTCNPTDIDGITTEFGYAAGTSGAVSTLLDDTTDFTVAAGSTGISDADVIIAPADLTISATLKCFVEYSAAASGGKPTYDIIDDDC